MTHTPESLAAFTERVRLAFLAKKIRAPIHLNSSSQAEPLIEIFKNINPQDHVFSTWRSAWHLLLKGMPEDELFQEILAGRSMFLSSKKYRFMSSAIVGGMLPIALGVAAGIKRKRDSILKQRESNSDKSFADGGGDYGAYLDTYYRDEQSLEKVFVFVGDMCSRTGLFHEFRQYCEGHSLPVHIVIEDNGLSTDTPTEEVWGTSQELPIIRYKYERTTPHVGVGTHVFFR